MCNLNSYKKEVWAFFLTDRVELRPAWSWHAGSEQRRTDVRRVAAVSRRLHSRTDGGRRTSAALLDVPVGLARREVPDSRAARVVAAAAATTVTRRQRVLGRPALQ